MKLAKESYSKMTLKNNLCVSKITCSRDLRHFCTYFGPPIPPSFLCWFFSGYEGFCECASYCSQSCHTVTHTECLRTDLQPTNPPSPKLCLKYVITIYEGTGRECAESTVSVIKLKPHRFVFVFWVREVYPQHNIDREK
jgi:hypothetical protein